MSIVSVAPLALRGFQYVSSACTGLFHFCILIRVVPLSSHIPTQSFRQIYPPAVVFFYSSANIFNACSNRAIYETTWHAKKVESTPSRSYLPAAVCQAMLFAGQSKLLPCTTSSDPDLSPKASAIVSNILWWQISGAVRAAG